MAPHKEIVKNKLGKHWLTRVLTTCPVSIFSFLGLSLMISCLATSARAAIIMGSNSFDNSLHGWYSADGWAQVANPASGGVGDSGWMSTTWTNLAGLSGEPDPSAEWWSNLFLTDATNLFTGTWSTNMFFSLDFWASNNAPEAVQIWTTANLVDDLANIDWVGIQIWRGDMASDTYGLDDFNLMIPEPAEIILLLFAGASSFMSLRRKRKADISTGTHTSA